jgi:putative ABC transport system permease protein
VRPATLLYFHWRRLRTHPIQELLAGFGIATGVALAFAVLVANGSIASSASEIVRGVTGSADFQLMARDARGFDARLLREARQAPGVRRAAPILDQQAVVTGPNGRRIAIGLVSIDRSLAAFSGRLAANFAASGLRLVRGVLLPAATARALGIPDPTTEPVARRLPSVQIALRGRGTRLPVAAILGPETIGPVARALVAIVPLQRLQELAGLPDRVTRVLVEAEPGKTATARAALARIAHEHHLTLTRASSETKLLRQALGPSDQATGFFAAISAMLGFLLAFNAMLLTAPERRRMIAELRIQGFRPRQLVGLVLFQALVLGTLASIAGLVAGRALSSGAFDTSADYLAPAFTLGTGTLVGVGPTLLALTGGIGACVLASAPPLLDLRRTRAVDAIFHATGAPGNALTSGSRSRLLAGALALLAVATGLLLLAPSAALAACGILAIATVCAIPTVFAMIVRGGEALARRARRLGMLTIALLALRRTTLRALALAATGAIAVFGSVAIGGAREDLLRGIAQYTRDYVGTADLWIVNGHDNQATNDFRVPDAAATVARVPGVVDVRTYRGGFLDLDGRRIWVIARPPSDASMLPESQVLHGDLTTATTQLRGGGWVAISDQVAQDMGLEVGDRLTLPTPTGERDYRLAATTTNLGWPPGAVIFNGDDYRDAWPHAEPTALEVDVDPSTDLAAVRDAVDAALGADVTLHVQTAHERSAGIASSARAGLERLSQISLLLLIAAVLAIGAAMGAAIWQRRASLAALRIQSFTPQQLWRVLLLESGIVLGAGCLTGALAGVYGQLGIDRYLQLITGFPVAAEPGGWSTIQTFALVVGAALVAVAIPGWFAARVPPRLGLQE